jgi:hypothetical protein
MKTFLIKAFSSLLLAGILVSLLVNLYAVRYELGFGNVLNITLAVFIFLATLVSFWLGIRFVKGIFKDEKSFIRLGKMLVTTAIALSGLFYEINNTIGPDMARKSTETVSKGALLNLRSAIDVFYGDHNGECPKTLQELVPKYINRIPESLNYHRYHNNSNSVILAEEQRNIDTGEWFYDSKSGKVYINCTHTDTKNQLVNSW